MRILQLTPRVASSGLDGGRIAMRNLADGLRSAGAEVVTLSLNPRKHFVAAAEAGCETIEIDTTRAFAGLAHSVAGVPLNIARFWSKDFAKRVAVIARGFDVVQLEELHMAQYIDTVRQNSSAAIVLRPLNVESQVWRRLATSGRAPTRVARKLLAGWIARHERTAIEASDACVTVTKEDADVFRSRVAGVPFLVAPVGVRLADYDSAPTTSSDVCFIGSLDYAPNYDGLVWFLAEVWPALRDSGVAFRVGGSGGSSELQDLVRASGAMFAGRVDDAREFVRRHGIVVAPLLAGGGMRVKIVEALALGRAVVTTTVGAEGLGAVDRTHLRIADTPAAFVAAVRELTANPDERVELGANGRRLIEEKFDAARIGSDTLAFYEQLLRKGMTPRTPESKPRRRAVILTARSPWPPYTGDRLRTMHWLEALKSDYDVTLVAPKPRVARRDLDSVELRTSPLAALSAAGRILARRLPFHYLLAGRFDWKRAEQLLVTSGEYDVAIVVLTRAAAWLDPRRFARAAILDAVDSLSENMTERASHSRQPMRFAWSMEASRTARHQRSVGSSYDAITLTATGDPEAFSVRSIAIPVGIEILPLEIEAPRRFDFGFWGRLPYFANSDAVDLLLKEIWPRIRASLPTATLLLGGAEAPRDIRDLSGKDGIEVISPMSDRAATLRQVTVALLPVRFGSGQSTKVLEASEAGCAIVAMPRALRGQPDFPAGAAVIEEDPVRFAAAAVRMHSDAAARASAAAAARKWVAERCDLSENLEQMRSLIRQVTRE